MTRRHRRAHVVIWGLLATGLVTAAFMLPRDGTRKADPQPTVEPVPGTTAQEATP